MFEVNTELAKPTIGSLRKMSLSSFELFDLFDLECISWEYYFHCENSGPDYQ